MRRRDFIAGFGAASSSALWPLAARAQQPAVPVIGFMHPGSPDVEIERLAGLRQGLKEAGYVEGQNVTIEYRWANGQIEQLPAFAADLVRRRVAVILAAGGDRSALAAKAATSSIPIVFGFGFDPVKLGLVASLNRPGGNATGVTGISTELGGKRLDLLLQWVPGVTTVAYLADIESPTSVYEEQMDGMLAATRALGRQLLVLQTRNEGDFEAAFATVVERRAGALVVGAFARFGRHRDRLLALAARHKIPAIYQDREWPAAGGLMSYGASYRDAYRLGGVYVAQILKGAKPADLPVQQATKFELIINLKTANALGLQVPPQLLALADEVIE